MSDDTPTQRFDAPLTPTTPLTPTPGSTPPEGRTPEERRRRALMFVFIGLSAALLLALIIVLIILFTRDSTPTAAITPTTSPSASASASAPASQTPTASSTPSAAASAAAPPPASKPTTAPTPNGAPVFTTFSIPDATCAGTTGTSPVTIQYSSVGATAAYFGISVANAKEAPTDGPLPPNGPYTFDYQCSNPTQIWVITLVDGAGGTTNKSREVHSGAK